MCSINPTSVQACRFLTLFRKIAIKTLQISAWNWNQEILHENGKCELNFCNIIRIMCVRRHICILMKSETHLYINVICRTAPFSIFKWFFPPHQIFHWCGEYTYFANPANNETDFSGNYLVRWKTWGRPEEAEAFLLPEGVIWKKVNQDLSKIQALRS